MAKLDLKKTIRGLSFFTRALKFFGGIQKTGDQYVFDQRGAIRITDKEVTNKDGEIVKIRGVVDAGSGSLVIPRPGVGQPITAMAAMDSYRGWVYACVKSISDEISNIEFKVFKLNKKGEHEELDSHPLLDFLDTVNDFQTGPEFKQTLASHLELTGNAYILLGEVKNYEAKPKFMFLLNPSKVNVFLDKTTFPYKIARYEYTQEGKKWSFQPYEIVHVKYPDPNNPYLGIGTVQGISEWVSNDEKSTEFLRQFFIHGAQIGVTFETEFVGEEQLQEMKDAFEEQHSGVSNAFKAMFLPKGVKKPTNDIKFGDIAFDEITTTNRDRILAGFRVSKTILGTAESETNRATAETADYVFSRRTIRPKMQLICSYLNEFLVPRFGNDIYLTFVDPVPEDRTTKINEMRGAIGSVPVLTADEAREQYLGLPPVMGGEKLLTPNNYIPAEKAGEYQQPYQLSAEKKEWKPKSKVGYVPPRTGKNKTQFAINAELRKEISGTLSEKIANIVLSVKQKGVNEMTDEEYDNVIVSEKRVRTSSYAEKIIGELQKINEKQKEEVLANLESAIKSVKAVDPNKLFSLSKWVNIVIAGITPIAKDLFSKEADQALKLINEPGLDIENTPAAKTAIKQAMTLMSQSYNKDTIDILESKINEGLSQGFGSAQLGELVQDIYAWKDKVAADRVARTESNRIANTAGKIAWKESGVVREIKWVTLGGDSACEFCQEMDGKTISIDKNFFDKGDTIEGADGGTISANYSDIGAPPLHPNCRCDTKPVLTKKIQVTDIIGKDIDAMDDELEDAILDEAITNLEDDNGK